MVSLESAKTPFADQIYAEQTTEIIKLFCSVETMPIPQEWLVELRGFEPLTSAVRLQRSPN